MTAARVRGNLVAGGGAVGRDWRLWFVAPTVLALAMVVLFPSGYLVWMSLQHWFITEPDVYFDGLANFRALLSLGDFWAALTVTAIYLIASTVLMLILAMLLATALAGSGGGSSVLRSILVLPLVIPPVVAGFTWRFLLNGEIGFLGAWVLPALGLDVNLLATPGGALTSVIIADVWSRMPFMFLIFLASLQSIPRDYYEAIRLDGAGPVREFLLITLPMLKGAIAVALLFRIVDAINTFELIYVMTKGGPGRSTQTLSLMGWKTAFQNYDLGGAAALGMVMLIVTTICASILYARFTREG